MRHLFALIIILVALSACIFIESSYVRLANQITLKVAKQLQKEDNLVLVGTGGGMMNDIQLMAMSFDIYHEVGLTEARGLLVRAVEKYLFAINTNEKVRPYLHEYPFTAKNVEIRIWVLNPDKTQVSLDKICYFSAIDGTCSYYLQEANAYPKHVFREESFEEAVEKVKSQQESSNDNDLKGET